MNGAVKRVAEPYNKIVSTGRRATIQERHAKTRVSFPPPPTHSSVRVAFFGSVFFRLVVSSTYPASRKHPFRFVSGVNSSHSVSAFDIDGPDPVFLIRPDFVFSVSFFGRIMRARVSILPPSGWVEDP